MSLFPLKPAHAPVKKYYAALAQFQKHGHTTEGNTRSAFADLLKRCCSHYGWHLVEEYQFKGTGKQSLRADGALVDDLTVQHGIWEAKDSDDDLQKEIKAKIAKGYRLDNILFQSPTHAVLYQDNRIAFNDSIESADKLVEVLECFFNHKLADIPDWEEAVTKFAEKIPDLARGVTAILEAEDKKNLAFRENFQFFAELCRQSINPELTDDAIRKMLVQHLLTERIFRKVFNNQEFLSRNVIAAEIEKVIRSITDKHFSRDTFLKPLDRFYTAIEKAAESQQGYTEKQHFLNAVYEKFFQRFDTKQADTHGIVYTPQPIVDFMVRSVDEILQQEFGKTLSDPGVHILDPFTGTGNFITRIMQQIKRSALPQKYAEELHCNEIMLLPYYIASMNIEHAYMERLRKGNELGEYKSFEGICLVDTFDLAESKQHSLFTAENTERVERQKVAPIFVVIANPPYRMQQPDENENNKNRDYPAIDKRVSETYTTSSTAQLRSKLHDPYVRAIRWASDRIGEHGIVCFVTNNGFIDQRAFDGMRKHLQLDFDTIMHLDLKGNARTSGERRRREGGNVFDNQIRVGVGISLFVRNRGTKNTGISMHRVGDYIRSSAKKTILETYGSMANTPKTRINPNSKNNWLTEGEEEDFEDLLAVGRKGSNKDEPGAPLFRAFGLGVNTARDTTAYSESIEAATAKANEFAEGYALELERFREAKGLHTDYVFQTLNWSRNLKSHLLASDAFEMDNSSIIQAMYRPYRVRTLILQDVIIDEPGVGWDGFHPGRENSAICWNISSTGAKYCLATNLVPDYHFVGDTGCFVFFNYSKSGARSENITESALAEFRTYYADNKITKWDIFHATYAILHHPEYRTRYAANLKRELPRIPFPPDFHAFAAAGKRLMELHIDYEKQPEYKLEQIEDPKAEVTFRVERMRLSKDKSELRYNDFLLLRGIPAAAFDYRLGNRSALEWVIDQYRVSTDNRSGIVNDPNRADDPGYIRRLIGQVITVSVETQRVIAGLPSLNLGE